MKFIAKKDTIIKFGNNPKQSSDLDPKSEFINVNKGFLLKNVTLITKKLSHQLVETDNIKGWIYLNHWILENNTFASNNEWLWESIKEFEDFRNRPYYDTGGVLTIGFGRTHEIQRNEITTPQKEKDWTLNYLNNLKIEINKLVNIQLNINQLDALAHFVYNIGINAFKNSTLLKKLNNGDILGAANEFPRWNKDAKRQIQPGLVRRRKYEKEYFLK